MKPGRTRLARLLAIAIAAAFLIRAPGAAQGDPDSLSAESDTIPRGVSPRGAMLRSFLLPGWGQAAVGSTTRAAIWFGIEGANVFMLVKTLRRLGESEDRERDLVRLRSDSLNAAIAEDTALTRRVLQDNIAIRLADPLAFDSAVDADSAIRQIRGLVNARKQQRQDWITYTLFFTLLSGVDAYVNAHLHDFPVDISMRNDRDGTVRFSLSLPVGHRPRPGRSAIPAAPALPTRRW
ncbi:MAG: DUF5683 domain-containing protein [Gemmatimonadetes bacterium]|nr:DUF5683 domain-containing protein [Gemmatimonadota bacterium]